LLTISWNWIFFINVPFGVIGSVLAFVFIRDSTKRHHLKDFTKKQKVKMFDWAGVILFAISIATLMLVIINLVFQNGPITTLFIVYEIILACVCVGSIVALIVVEVIVADYPVIPFSMFKAKNVTLPIVSGLFAAFARGNINFGSIFFFQGPYLQTPFMAGVLLIPFGLGNLLGGLPAGKLADAIGSRLLITLGPIMAAIGIVPAFFMEPTYTYWFYAVPLFITGLGWGIYNSPNARTMMLATKPKNRGVTAAISLMVSMFAQTFSIILAFSIILKSVSYPQLLQLFIYANASELEEYPSISVNYMGGVHVIFYITCAVSAIPAIFSFFTDNLFMPTIPPNTHQEKKEPEKDNEEEDGDVDEKEKSKDEDENLSDKESPISDQSKKSKSKSKSKSNEKK